MPRQGTSAGAFFCLKALQKCPKTAGDTLRRVYKLPSEAKLFFAALPKKMLK
jgi:hypothetical protein